MTTCVSPATVGGTGTICCGHSVLMLSLVCSLATGGTGTTCVGPATYGGTGAQLFEGV